MDIPLGVRFSPVLIRLLFAECTEIASMNATLSTVREVVLQRKDLIAQMTYGAYPFACYLKRNGWPLDIFCEPAATQLGADALRSAVRFVDTESADARALSPRQRCVFFGWLNTVGADVVQRFLRLVTGAPCIDADHSAVVIGLSPQAGVVKVHTCFNTLLLPECALESVTTCQAFLERELKDTNSFNIL
jgi:hypothetical protein